MKTVIIYHRSDYDGLMSGAICKYALEKRGVTDLQMIGWDYGDPIPVIEDDSDVYMVDISIDGMMDYPNLIWIDHHKSAIEKWDTTSISGLRIDGVAACRLCWQYFWNYTTADIRIKGYYVNRSLPEPMLVRLIGEFDVWDHRDPSTKTLQLGLRANGIDLDDLVIYLKDWHSGNRNDVARRRLENWVEDGATIQRYTQAVDAETINAIGYELDFEGVRFVALNGTQRGSLVFEGYHRIKEVDACLIWRYEGDKVRVSMYHTPYSKPGLDLSLIAVKHGGGGHKGACGFQIEIAESAPCGLEAIRGLLA